MSRPTTRERDHLDLELAQLEDLRANDFTLPPDLDLDEVLGKEGFKGFTLGQAGLLTCKPKPSRRLRS